ncbi:hypothetical protein COCON_G00173700 [Conger conger]|uniref:Telomeric repeat-binding factor 2-interacting protein 1 n=1 Tax=Conger conger TaxID=82655 RepID=A0A9Q1HS98_CONCO|nr:hypothetical protein COCON_G00173700 [Conger conger]
MQEFVLISQRLDVGHRQLQTPCSSTVPCYLSTVGEESGTPCQRRLARQRATMCSVIDSRSSPLSRVLFLSETGKPMRFFMRPGATKTQLQPIISAGGGVVCRVQEPNAILLLDPEEMNEGFGGAAARYVSTQYVLDCVEKNQQLEVDDYRFSDDSVQIAPAKRKREASGRMCYSAEEDAAILGYVRGRVREVCGNRLWQQMEREAVTTHSWQSMKDRYRKHLSKQPLEGDTEPKQTFYCALATE